MRKRSKYKPYGVNPVAHLMAIHGAAKLNAVDRNRFMPPVQVAVDSIAAGKGERAHWDALFDSINTVEQLLAAGLAKNWREWHEAIQDTVLTVLERQNAAGTRALYPSELATLRSLAETWGDILGVVSCREMLDAQRRAERKVGQALAGNVPGARLVEAVL